MRERGGPPPLATIRRGYADTRFGQLHYAEAGSGPVLLMLHQTPRSHDEFAELQPLLADVFRTIAMDMVGFGMSASNSTPQTVEGMAGGALALLDALGVETAHVLGHHTGAAVAQEMSVQAPDRVGALVLSAMPWVDERQGSDDQDVEIDNAPTAEDGSHLLELWRQRRPYYPTGRPELLNRFIRDALAPGLDPAEGHRAVNRYAMPERISAVTAPVLLVVPTADPFAVEALPSVRAALVNASFVEVCRIDGGQVPAMEQLADEVAERVREFLTNVDDACLRSETGRKPIMEGRSDA